MMWGDPETAANLTPANGNSDSLSLLLLQVTGPAHIPWNDPRWQELLLAYDVWVHVDHNRLMNDDLITMACTSMAKHAIMSSNLASLAWHVARMTKEWAMALLPVVENDIDDETATAATAMTRGNYYANNNSYNNDNNSTTTSSLFTNQIALVGKARATAGAMHLLRIFIHDIDPTTLGDVLVYTSRDVSDKDHFKQSGQELIGALLTLLSIIGPMTEPLERVPEIYDATVNCLELLIVLLSTQLYQPMIIITIMSLHGHHNPFYKHVCYGLTNDPRLLKDPFPFIWHIWQNQLSKPREPKKDQMVCTKHTCWYLPKSHSIKTIMLHTNNPPCSHHHANGPHPYSLMLLEVSWYCHQVYYYYHLD